MICSRCCSAKSAAACPSQRQRVCSHASWSRQSAPTTAVWCCGTSSPNPCRCASQRRAVRTSLSSSTFTALPPCPSTTRHPRSLGYTAHRSTVPLRYPSGSGTRASRRGCPSRRRHTVRRPTFGPSAYACTSCSAAASRSARASRRRLSYERLTKPSSHSKAPAGASSPPMRRTSCNSSCSAIRTIALTWKRCCSTHFVLRQCRTS
mmetsp:Transcript_7752/g.20243  ORF Transcript_7752/g.20243 Transcript_7752/m.20243 type:complete len:206 (+) Transcript_7752:325-942(+)